VGAGGKPKNVRSEWRWAIGRVGLRATTPLTCIFGRLFFVTFFWRTKESKIER